MQVAGRATAATTGSRALPTTRRSSSRPKVFDFNGQGPGLGEYQRARHRVPARHARPVQIGDVRRREPDFLRPGFSFGGMMSNAVGCAGLARAIAPMAGNCDGEPAAWPARNRVAYMGFHGYPRLRRRHLGRTHRARRVREAQRVHLDDDAVVAELVRWARLELPAVQLRDLPGLRRRATPSPGVSTTPITRRRPTPGPTLWSFFSQFWIGLAANRAFAPPPIAASARAWRMPSRGG